MAGEIWNRRKMVKFTFSSSIVPIYDEKDDICLYVGLFGFNQSPITASRFITMPTMTC